MASQNFIDHVKIFLRSGDGGRGSVHWRREKFVPKGGPDGGDGGRGGHIVLRGDRQLWTLLHLKYQKHIKADNGQPGGGQRMTGASGDDIVLDLPLGTVARDAESGEILAEITEHDQTVNLYEGGKGGQGNWHFRSATNQAPEYAQPGISGQEGWVIFELKLLADVGLVGFPNAGKSTLLSVLSAARPKVADYPFTTLKPNLGMVAYRDHRSFVMADIPGIIEGAAEGKGLGLRFLRHIERNSCLLFMVPADSPDIAAQYRVLRDELRRYNPELMTKDRVLAVSKADLADAELRELLMADLQTSLEDDLPVLFISAVAQEGLTELKDLLWSVLNRSDQDDDGERT